MPKNKMVQHLVPIEDSVMNAVEDYVNELIVQVESNKMNMGDALFEIYKLGFTHGGDTVISMFNKENL